MMQYDLIIQNGTIVDGSGLPRFRADLGIVHGKIATIGKIRASAKETIDAEGHVVAPGFIDGHTHMDAQVNWDPLGTCSVWHGITSVVMGNCGFSLAPCAEANNDVVMRNLERAEDISPVAMAAGIKWTWETFPEYLDTIENLPKGINYSAYLGHSALRTYVMGERAFHERATPQEIERMKREVRDSIRAGAMGFTTSRSQAHRTPQGDPVASRLASWDEVRQLVGVMGEMNAGIVVIASENPLDTPEALLDYQMRLKDLAVDTGVPITYGQFSRRDTDDTWRSYLALADETAQAGGRMFIQAHSRALNLVLSFETHMPYDKLPVWRDLRQLPLAEQAAALRDPAMRRKLIDAANQQADDGGKGIGPEARAANYDHLYVMDSGMPPYRTVAEVAKEMRKDPTEVVMDLALEKDMKQFFLQPIANENQDHALELIKHPRTVVTFSDSGAHVSQIMDSSLQTHLLAYWVREKQQLALEEAVRQLTFVPASFWGMSNRGMLREGYAADVVVFDADRIAPMMPELVYDLPAGERRLKQKSAGIAATVVNGEVLMRHNEHTGALPGQLIRGPLAAK
jgi:N-acyl-D-aspartate/D-glutamate deacylase